MMYQMLLVSDALKEQWLFKTSMYCVSVRELGIWIGQKRAGGVQFLCTI